MRWDTDPSKWGKVQLWEYGRRRLGYGNWDPDSGESYVKWCGLEAHKLFLVMKKRRIKASDFILCVDYCHTRHVKIENAVWVFQSLALAKDWDKDRHVTDIQQLVDEALAYEQTLAASDSPMWIGRLTRARGPFRQEVVDEWQASRNPQTSTPAQ